MYHYTNDKGYKAIASQVDWTFKAVKPPGPHPIGAYFTPLPPDTPDLCTMLLIPKHKTEYLFEFSGAEGLIPLDGGKGRGRHVLYSGRDYVVVQQRQIRKGKSEESGKEPST